VIVDEYYSLLAKLRISKRSTTPARGVFRKGSQARGICLEVIVDEYYSLLAKLRISKPIV